MDDKARSQDELRAEVRALRAEVTALRRAAARHRTVEESLRRSEALARELVQSINSIVLRWDPEGRITFLNEYGLQFFGYTEEEIVGRSVLDLIVPETESSGRDLRWMIHDLLRHPENYASNENENIRRDGRRVWITWRNRPIVDAHGQLREIISTGIDTTKRKRIEEALRESEERFRHLSIHDNLTGLYNTRYLYQALDELIASSAKASQCFSLIFMDLDHFKRIVDTYGHLNGSRVIQEVAATIRGLLDEPAYGVAYAGDEFVIVLPGVNKLQCTKRAEEIRSRIRRTVFLSSQGYAVRLSASFGVATYPDDGTGREGLMTLADQALFDVKARGKNAVGAAGGAPPAVQSPRATPR